jgi:hypothetical protein
MINFYGKLFKTIDTIPEVDSEYIRCTSFQLNMKQMKEILIDARITGLPEKISRAKLDYIYAQYTMIDFSETFNIISGCAKK